jgi:p-cumate 2,3-dioxygenase subunit beta
VYQGAVQRRAGRRPGKALFIIADNMDRIARVVRLRERNAHAEYPPSRTRRLISNVRIVAQDGPAIDIEANFVVCRFRRNEHVREYVGRYRYGLRLVNGALRIARREATLEAMELGSLGSVSFIL